MVKSRSNLGSGLSLAYSHSLLLLIFVSNTFFSTSPATCYLPDGTDLNAGEFYEVYQPCDDGNEHSMCCALNRPDDDRCRSDGLCLSTYDSNVWRDRCTDPTWKSTSCIKLCVSGRGQYIAGSIFDLASDTTTVTPCENGSYCCGNGTIGDACCREGKGLFVSNGEAVSSIASSSSTKADLSTSFSSTESTLSTSFPPTQPTLSTSFSSTKLALSPSLSSTEVQLSLSSRNSSSHIVDSFARTTTCQDSSTFTSSASSSPSSSFPAVNSSEKAGLIVGGVIGGTAVLAFISGIIAWTWINHNRRNPQGNGTHQKASTGQTDHGRYAVPENNGIYEVDAVRPIVELEVRPIVEVEVRPILELEVRPIVKLEQEKN